MEHLHTLHTLRTLPRQAEHLHHQLQHLLVMLRAGLLPSAPNDAAAALDDLLAQLRDEPGVGQIIAPPAIIAPAFRAHKLRFGAHLFLFVYFLLQVRDVTGVTGVTGVAGCNGCNEYCLPPPHPSHPSHPSHSSHQSHPSHPLYPLHTSRTLRVSPPTAAPATVR